MSEANKPDSSTHSSSRDVRSLCELIWQLEESLELLRWQVHGVFLWQVVRVELYYRLAEAAGILSAPSDRLPPPRLSDKTAALLRIAAQFPRDLWTLIRLGKTPTLIVEHERHKSFEGKQVDIYTHFLQRQLQAEGKRFLVLEPPWQGRHRKTFIPPRIYGGLFRIGVSVLARLRPTAMLDESHRQTIAELEGKIVAWLGRPLPFDLTQYLTWHLRNFPLQREAYFRFFRLLGVRELFLTVAYFQTPLIAAAKDLGIRVTELQHGVISRYHLGYSFPVDADRLHYFPDRLLGFGPEFGSTPFLPLPKEAHPITGFAYLDTLKGLYPRSASPDDTVLVISQGSLADRIAQAVGSQMEGPLANRQIIYKLHPAEYARWRSYPALLELSKSERVRVIDHDEDLYALYSRVAFTVGVYSTALHEALAFGCQVRLLNLPGVEYMQDVIENHPLCSMLGEPEDSGR